MNVTEIIELFSNPETIHTLTTGQKSIGVGFTVALGMSITFVSLVILQFVMTVMSKFMDDSKVIEKKTAPVKKAAPVAAAPAPEVSRSNDEEVIAAITAALSVKLKTPMSNIIIRNIKKVNNNHHTWNNVGVVEQMNSRL